MKFMYLVALLFLNVERGSCKNLVLVGGGLEDEHAAIWDKIVELGGGVGIARFGIVAASSGTPYDSAKYYIERLLHYGAASADWIQIDESRKDNNEDPATIDLILSQTAFFFSGGDQARVINSFYHFPERTESSALAAIRQVYNAGGLIAGSSAGTACQSSNVMVAGGLSYDALRYGAYPGGYNPDYPDDLSYDEFGGIGMVSGMVLDSHFSERGREGRLIRLVADTMHGPLGTSLGVGVDENTALVIYDVGTSSQTGEVIAAAKESGVLFLDLSKATVSTIGDEWAISKVQSTFLTDGDTFDFIGGKVTFAPWKTNLLGNEYYLDAIISDDIFCNPDKSKRNTREFAKVTRRLYDNIRDVTTYGETDQRKPRFRVSVDKSVVGSVGFGGYHVVNGDFYVSYSGLDTDISAV